MFKKPNIVILITDSQGWNVLGRSGSGFIQTPNIDRLADEGVSFERAYNCCPLCTPARAGLFTGQYPHNAGAWANDLALGNTVRTIGEYLQKAGYRTAYTGKWHLDGTDYFGTGITPQGYDPEYWFDGRNYLDELPDDDKTLWRRGLKLSKKIAERGVTREFTWAGRITDRALKFLSEKDDKPFLLVASYDEPHSPSVCPPPFCDMYKDFKYPVPGNFSDTLADKPEHHQEWAKALNVTPEKIARQSLYFGSASFIDDEIGRVMNAVDQIKDRDTIVIFTTDHGHYLGAHKLDGKGPALYEEVVRVPLIVRAKGLIPAGTKSNSIASHIDIIPTLLDFAGIEAPPILEGRSMKASLASPERSYRDEAFVEFHRFSATHDSWFGFIPIRAIVTQEYKLVINLNQTDELYDLENDPGEMQNLITKPEHSEIRNQLHVRLIDFMNRSRDPFRGIAWETRPWRADKKFTWVKGERRSRPYDGFLPRTYNYDTGKPD